MKINYNLKSYKLQPNKGFSMVETIVYLAIFAMFAGTLVTFVFNLNSSRLHSQIMLEVNDQGASLMRLLTRSIESASAINSPGTGGSSGVLSINTSDPLTTPTVFSEDGETLYITEGASDPVALTNNKVRLTDLNFTNVSRSATPGIIQIRFTIGNTAAKTLAEEQYSASFYGSSSLK